MDFHTLNADILDDKLSVVNKEYLRKEIRAFLFKKIYAFKIEKYRLNNVTGTIFFEDNMKSSVNITLINITINLTVMRKKIKMFEKRNLSKKNILMRIRILKFA